MLASPDYTSFCDISSTVSCEAVLSSRFATMFGIPVAAGGAIWSALVLLLAAFGMKPSASAPRATADRAVKDDAPGRVAGYIFILSTIGLAAVLYLAYASFFILRTACPICMTMYVGVLGLFIVSGAAASGLAGLPGRMGRDLTAVMKSPLAATLAIVWLVASVSLVAFFPREQSVAAPAEEAAYVPPTEVLGADEISQFQAWMDAQPRVQVDVPRPEGAKVMVIKFNDYQCPACKQAYILYKSIQAKVREGVPGAGGVRERRVSARGRMQRRRSALLGLRSGRRGAAGHREEPQARDGSVAVRQSGNTHARRVKEGLAQIAQVTNFDERYKDELEKVKAEAQMGQKLQVTGTPTFFIDGIRIGSTLRPAYFDAAIAYELKKASASTS
jgi:uncharacterized membrane protein